jgi:hypothetical protein
VVVVDGALQQVRAIKCTLSIYVARLPQRRVVVAVDIVFIRQLCGLMTSGYEGGVFILAWRYWRTISMGTLDNTDERIKRLH